jgi:fucose 4-O-acetylase-like acetyltransferase
MIFVLLDRVLKKAPSVLRWIVFMSLPGFTMAIHSIFSPNLVPWRFGIILLSTSFAFIGNEMRRTRGLRVWSFHSHLQDILAFLIILCALIFISDFNGFTDIAVDNYGVNAWVYLYTGTVGTILVFILSNAILSLPKLKQAILTYGNNSQEVYEVHPPLFYLVPLFMLLLGWSLTDYLTLYADLWIFRFSLGISLSLIISTQIIKKNKLLQLIFKGRTSNPSMKTFEN